MVVNFLLRFYDQKIYFSMSQTIMWNHKSYGRSIVGHQFTLDPITRARLEILEDRG